MALSRQSPQRAELDGLLENNDLYTEALEEECERVSGRRRRRR